MILPELVPAMLSGENALSVRARCPYCGFAQWEIVSGRDEYAHLVWCDSEEGGCDSHYMISVHPKAEIRSFALRESMPRHTGQTEAEGLPLLHGFPYLSAWAKLNNLPYADFKRAVDAALLDGASYDALYLSEEEEGEIWIRARDLPEPQKSKIRAMAISIAGKEDR